MLMSSAASQTGPSKCWWEPRSSTSEHCDGRHLGPRLDVRSRWSLRLAAFLLLAFCSCAPFGLRTVFFNCCPISAAWAPG